MSASVTQAISAGAFNVALGESCALLYIWLDLDASDVNFTIDGSTAATASNAKLEAGGALKIDLPVAISTLKCYGAGATGNINVVGYVPVAH